MLKIIKKWGDILGSLVGGWLLALLMLGLAGVINDQYWARILVWHARPVMVLTGRMFGLEIDSEGQPVCDDTGACAISIIIGGLAGFFIYPILIFLIGLAVKRLSKTSLP